MTCLGQDGRIAVDAAPAAEGLTVRYLGPFITDTTTPGETKRDRIIPGHPGGGALRLAVDRWLILFSTLDPAGWDACRSILYQLRADAPDGPILREGVLASSLEAWDPLDRGDRLVKMCGMPVAFGVPQGATAGSRPLPSAGVFVVKWYRFAQLRRGDRLLHPSDPRHDWTEGPWIKQRTLRLEWAQFQLNRTRDDIELLADPCLLRQQGYEQGEALCALGPDFQMNHAMKAPVPENADCTAWVSCDTFVPYDSGRQDHGSVAPVRYVFNPRTRLYEWRDTGRLVRVPGRVIGEASVNRVGGVFVIALRGFEYNHSSTDTLWFAANDLFGDWGRPRFTDATACPRIAFTCGDGALRLFANRRVSHDRHVRSVLACWDMAPDTLEPIRARTIFDARQGGLPFVCPLADMPKLCPAQGTRQLLLFRLIDRVHTANLPGISASNEAAFALAGIHAAELNYPAPAASPWTFGACEHA